jgi:methylated-DNA-[protein]-cysteine S-methyltransferase
MRSRCSRRLISFAEGVDPPSSVAHPPHLTFLRRRAFYEETMPEAAWDICDSPVGPLTILAGDAGLRAVLFDEPRRAPDPRLRREMPAIREQLAEYFAGERLRFDVDLDLAGGPLQLAVWARLREIPYGGTVSYGELTAELDPRLFPAELEPYRRVRRAASEIGRTPTPIVVPCHRVIGADGSLTGYGGGLERKRALLDLESGALAPRLC